MGGFHLYISGHMGVGVQCEPGTEELLTAKANIDRIVELDKEQAEANERREKEAEQR